MLDKFVETLDYARWFSNNSLKIRPPNFDRKLSYVEMAKSSLFNSPIPRPKFKVTDQTTSKKAMAVGSKLKTFPWIIDVEVPLRSLRSLRTILEVS